MGKIIAIANQKGGVGKTTTAISFGGCLGVLEYKTLIVDADPQANATSGLGFDPQNTKNIYDCLINGVHPEELIIKTENPNLDILPSHIDLVGAEIEMIDLQNREYMLKIALDKVKEDYDFIIIDCSPSLGLITVNALTAAASVAIPVQCEFFALEGLKSLKETIRLVQDNMNNDLKILGILITMHTKRLRLAKKVEALLKANFKNKLLKTKISRNIRLAEAPDDGKPAIMYDVDCAGAKNYMELALEIVNEKK